MLYYYIGTIHYNIVTCIN